MPTCMFSKSASCWHPGRCLSSLDSCCVTRLAGNQPCWGGRGCSFMSCCLDMKTSHLLIPSHRGSAGTKVFSSLSAFFFSTEGLHGCGIQGFFGNLQSVQTKQGSVQASPPVGHAHLAGKNSCVCPTNLVYLLINLPVFSCGSRPNGPGRVTDTLR